MTISVISSFVDVYKRQVSSAGEKGDPGDRSIGQTFKGSPLRIVGAWTSGKKYYEDVYKRQQKESAHVNAACEDCGDYCE